MKKRIAKMWPFIGLLISILYLLLRFSGYNLPLFPYSGVISFVLLNIVLILVIGVVLGALIRYFLEE